MPSRTGPWNQAQTSQIENIRLPIKIPCSICHAVKLHARFSNRQLGDYRARIFYEGEVKATKPACTACSPASRTEMFCTGCNTNRPLNEFSKAQRKKPDDAKCIPCQQTIDDTIPNVEAAIEEDEIIENGGPSVQATIRGSTVVTPLTATGTGLTLGSGKSGTSVSDRQDGVWSRPVAPLSHAPSDSVHSEATNHTNATTQAPLTDTEWDTLPREDRPSRQRQTSSVSASSRAHTGTNPGFARQGAVPEDIHTRAARQRGRNERRAAAHSGRQDYDEEDGEDDWEL